MINTLSDLNLARLKYRGFYVFDTLVYGAGRCTESQRYLPHYNLTRKFVGIDPAFLEVYRRLSQTKSLGLWRG
jgi:hypothetical protein